MHHELCITLSTFATSHGTGPFHPAVQQGHKIYYWPNITCATEDEAQERAAKALADATEAANAVAREWNIYSAN